MEAATRVLSPFVNLGPRYARITFLIWDPLQGADSKFQKALKLLGNVFMHFPKNCETAGAHN